MSKKQKTTDELELQKQDFMSRFANESPAVRDSIVRDLPAYNALLSLRAVSFEEIVLRQLAKQQNIPYNLEHLPIPTCPWCKSAEHVGRKEAFTFRCRSCDKNFVITKGSIAYRSKCDALVWMKVLQCLLNYVSITQTCEYCNIREETYYRIRTRLFYAMSILLQDVRLYGNIEVDNTFVKVSYKGVNLKESEFPEDSIFFDPSPKPREPKARGGPIPMAMRNANQICIFTGIDNAGHVLTRFVGVGNVSYLSLKHYISTNGFLLQVPKKDPFVWKQVKKQSKKTKKTELQPQQNSLMIADKEGAIRRFADYLNIDFESHVYRKNGVQRKLGADSHGIQHVNALHRRLKLFLQKHGYVSSKYLPGYLTLFEFVENTGASQDAVAELFRIIASPEFGKPSTFFDELFTVPNYLEEWLHSEHPLSKFPHNKLLAFYMYDMIKHPDLYPDVNMTMPQIESETTYTDVTIRKIYREMNKAGYRDLVLQHFTGRDAKKGNPTKKKQAPSTLNPTVLAIYDDYAAIRLLPKRQQPTFNEFLKDANDKYGTNYKRTNILAKFKYIAEHGVRQPLPQAGHVEGPCDTAFQVLSAYEDIVRGYLEKGEKPPKNLQIFSDLSKRFELTVSVIERHVDTARAYLRRTAASNTEKNG